MDGLDIDDNKVDDTLPASGSVGAQRREGVFHGTVTTTLSGPEASGMLAMTV